jgi:uncharacterized membrane protein (UPF0127 family)
MKVVAMDGPGGGWRVLVPETRRERMRGLRRRTPPGPHEAMLLPDCRSVHTFGMREPISVILLDRQMRVIEVLCSPPRRVIVARRHARHVLEAAVGSGVRVGDRFSRPNRAKH